LLHCWEKTTEPLRPRGTVPDLSRRIADLPPERRRVFERLLEGRAAPPKDPDRRRGAPLPGTVSCAVESKADYRRFYNRVSEHLNSTEFGEFSFFLNYGYVPDQTPQYSRVQLPAHYLNRNSVKLALELIGDCDIRGLKVLDVGCGRGGTVSIIRTYFAPLAVTGIDLSSVAIAFCHRTHRHAGVSFLEADAEELPFRDESFEIVTNVESSHSYPDIARFYRETFRVLTPGGCFLYTDVLPVGRMRQCVELLKDTGFSIERARDITADVTLSCDQIAGTRLAAFDRGGSSGTAEEFLAVPGSEAYEEMRQGLSAYKMFKLGKRGHNRGRRIRGSREIS
jgi:phthiocerol/phenolphthiocerol synthesis type-I polyketide synthase E